MNITQDDICQLTCAIWESTLGLEVRPIPGPGLSERQACILIGRVQITGAWLGTVLLECSEELAQEVARIMFHLDSEEPTPEEVRDALAEITNITAGNFKSLAGGHCHLSVPQVTGRVLDQPTVPGEVVISRQAFACQGELFVVTVLEGEVCRCNPN
jgi:CheY-specific phosphatase CheX